MVVWDKSDSAPRKGEEFPLIDGRYKQGRVTFCFRMKEYDEGKYHPFKYCYDGKVRGDRIEFMMTTNIDHPWAPERAVRFTARRSVRRG